MDDSLVFEKLNHQALEGVHSLWSDNEATLFTNFVHSPNLEKTKEHLDRVLNYYSQNSMHFGPYSILSKSGTFLGLVGGDEADLESKTYEIWYFIKREFWGQKVATHAVQQLLHKMVPTNRVNIVKAEVVVDNIGSWKFLESLGFEKIDFLKNAHSKDGKIYDRFVYSKKLPREVELK